MRRKTLRTTNYIVRVITTIVGSKYRNDPLQKAIKPATTIAGLIDNLIGLFYSHFKIQIRISLLIRHVFHFIDNLDRYRFLEINLNNI